MEHPDAQTLPWRSPLVPWAALAARLRVELPCPVEDTPGSGVNAAPRKLADAPNAACLSDRFRARVPKFAPSADERRKIAVLTDSLRRAACTRSNAWSMIELLVAMGILALLLGLLVPVLQRARFQARSSTCLNHLRQWGLGLHLYAADHLDFLPPEGDPSPDPGELRHGWYVQVPETLGLRPPYHARPWRTNASAPLDRSLWICPGSTNRSNGLNLFHYCVNEHVDGSGSQDRRRTVGSILEPARLVWMFDNGRRAAVAQQNNVHTNAHRGGAQFLFVDGHARRFANREYWDFARGRGRTDHADLAWRNP